MLARITKELAKIAKHLKVILALCLALILLFLCTPLGDLFNGKVKEKVEEFKIEAKEKIEAKKEEVKEDIQKEVKKVKSKIDKEIDKIEDKIKDLKKIKLKDIIG